MLNENITKFRQVLSSIEAFEADFWEPTLADGLRKSAYDLEMYPADEMVKLRGVGYVHESQVDYYIQCDVCGYYFPVSGDISVYEMTEDRHICQDCYYSNSRYHMCDDCGVVIDLSDSTSRFSESGNRYCPECANNYDWCSECGRILDVDSEDFYGDDGDRICEECYSGRYSGIIQGYCHTRPSRMNFYKTDDEPDTERYFGIEIEIGGGGRDNYVVAKRILDNLDDRVECKSDSSIDDGFEIATMPMTFKMHLSYMDEWSDFFDFAKRNGFLSGEEVNCGLHIHVSRAALGESDEEINDNIDKILYIFEGFWDEVKEFSGRSEAQIEDWCNRYLNEGDKTTKRKVKERKATKEGGRYMAVNLSNSSTIEFRIFNGTIDIDEFYAALEFVNRIVDIVTTKSEDEIMEMTWDDIVEGDSGLKELAEVGVNRMISGKVKLKDMFEKDNETIVPPSPWHGLPIGTRVLVGELVRGGVCNNWAITPIQEETSYKWATIVDTLKGDNPLRTGYLLEFDYPDFSNNYWYSIGMFRKFILPKGCSVTVREDLHPGYYHGLFFASDMSRFRGCPSEIVTCDGSNYRLSCSNRFVFNNTMLKEAYPFAVELQGYID